MLNLALSATAGEQLMSRPHSMAAMFDTLVIASKPLQDETLKTLSVARAAMQEAKDNDAAISTQLADLQSKIQVLFKALDSLEKEQETERNRQDKELNALSNHQRVIDQKMKELNPLLDQFGDKANIEECLDVMKKVPETHLWTMY